MNTGIFKAYDIRGRYPQEINKESVSVIADALSNYWGEIAKNSKKKAKIIIGRDTRLGSSFLYRLFLEKLKTNWRLNIIPIGLTTTPMFYFLVNRLDGDAGAMVTASHNPKEDNGFKIVKKYALMVSGKEVLEIIRNQKLL